MRSRTERIEAEPRGRRRSWAKSGATALLSAAALVSSGFLAATPAAATPSSTVQVKHLCAQNPKPGHVACLAEERTDLVRPAGVSAHDTTPLAGYYGPADLQSAYNLPSSTAGSGQTVAVVDAMDDPYAESDLATYRSQYGLPACTTANGCFKKVDQNGTTSYPTADSGWAGEISLDLDMVSATCPQCHIVLVEASSTSINDLGTAVNQAVAQGAKFVSNSYGGAEDSQETSWDAYFNHPGVVLTASSGDSGYGVQYPAASPYVTSVGGTALTRASNARGWTETVWKDSGGAPGSGCSAYEPKPAWQVGTSCSHRTVADVSAVADPATGVSVYNTYDSGWTAYGGTSAASPIIAGTYALAGTPAAGSNPASYPYNDTSALNDVTSGNNVASGSCSPVYFCTAGNGYDGPTGWGTPNGTAAFTSGSGSTTSLPSGQVLLPGHSLSAGGLTLTMQTDGNLVDYLSTGPSSSVAVWASNTSGHAGAYAYMQADGNLVIYPNGNGPSNGGALWASNTSGHAGAYATLQSDGNFVVYKAGGSGALWATNVYDHSQTIASGTKLTAGWWSQATYTRLVMQRDGNLVIYRNRDGAALWASNTSGHAGAYAVMQSDGNLVIYSSANAALWSTKTSGHSGAYAILQNDGNFVVYKSGGGPSTGGALWSTGTYKYVP